MLEAIFDNLRPSQDGASVKFSHFFPIYDQHFLPCRDKIRRVLEIGVQAGGSLSMWLQYFPNIEQVIGVDNNPNCIIWTRDKVTVYTADSTNAAAMREICQRHGPFDVVIDDGGHTAREQRENFALMWPHVSDYGWYVIEDTQCSYWERLGGGYCSTGAMEVVKDLADCCTWWAIEGRAQKPEMEQYNQSVVAVHVHPAIVFVEKGHNVNHDNHYKFSDKGKQ